MQNKTHRGLIYWGYPFGDHRTNYKKFCSYLGKRTLYDIGGRFTSKIPNATRVYKDYISPCYLYFLGRTKNADIKNVLLALSSYQVLLSPQPWQECFPSCLGQIVALKREKFCTCPLDLERKMQNLKKSMDQALKLGLATIDN